jgi:hypothetical protein
MYPLSVPSSSYEAFIREALIDELKQSGIYSDSASTDLTIHFDQIDFTSAFTGNWVISAQFTIADKPPFSVATNYGIADVNWGPSLACSNTAAAFVPAVQNFLKALFLDPRFKEAIALPEHSSLEVSTPTSNTTSQKLRDLQALRKDGVITEEEFQAKKKQLLERM